MKNTVVACLCRGRRRNADGSWSCYEEMRWLSEQQLAEKLVENSSWTKISMEGEQWYGEASGFARLRDGSGLQRIASERGGQDSPADGF